MRPHVAWLHVAPIKALAVEEREQIELGPLGVDDDRRFCIVDPDARMVNAKRVHRLVAIRPTFSDGLRHLTLLMPDGTEVSGGVRLGSSVTVSLYRRHTPARIVLGPWSDALSSFAGRPVRLVRFDDAGEGVDRTGRDAGATLLSEGSLRAIAAAASVDGPVDPRRFRMLIGIADVPDHAEDGWIGRRVRVGGAVVMPRGNVGRCTVTTVDPATGISDLDTLAALARYRGAQVTTEPLAFGVWASVAEPGVVRVGDDVEADLR